MYDAWIDHSILFSDARIEMAFERFMQMVDTPGYVFDRSNMLSIFFFDNVVPLGADDCLMHKQGSFFQFSIEAFGLDPSDFGTFEIPTVSSEFEDATVGAGDYAGAVTDSRDVRDLMRFLASNRFGRAALAESELWIMPNTRFDTRRYTSDQTRTWAETIQAALESGQFRFDASDSMPAQVGAGSFWSGVVDLVAGVKTVPQVLYEIDASWP